MVYLLGTIIQFCCSPLLIIMLHYLYYQNEKQSLLEETVTIQPCSVGLTANLFVY